jgi:hypothetical protein
VLLRQLQFLLQAAGAPGHLLLEGPPSRASVAPGPVPFLAQGVDHLDGQRPKVAAVGARPRIRHGTQPGPSSPGSKKAR